MCEKPRKTPFEQSIYTLKKWRTGRKNRSFKRWVL
jgi:hypothetical protein